MKIEFIEYNVQCDECFGFLSDYSDHYLKSKCMRDIEYKNCGWKSIRSKDLCPNCLNRLEGENV